jgi:hypothetical protein
MASDSVKYSSTVGAGAGDEGGAGEATVAIVGSTVSVAPGLSTDETPGEASCARAGAATRIIAVATQANRAASLLVTP